MMPSVSYVLTFVSGLAFAFAAPQADIYPAPDAADVYAAQATAKTLSPTSHVKGAAFDRFVQIWLENTDYDSAKNDRELSFPPLPTITPFFLSIIIAVLAHTVADLIASKHAIHCQEGHHSYQLLRRYPS